MVHKKINIMLNTDSTKIRLDHFFYAQKNYNIKSGYYSSNQIERIQQNDIILPSFMASTNEFIKN